MGVLALSSFFAIDSSLSWEPLYEYLTIVFFYFVLLSIVQDSYQLVFTIASYITTMAVYLAKAQWEFFVHGQHRYDQGVIRMVGIESSFGGPNSLAMSIVVSLPMLAFLWSFRNEFSLGWPEFWRKWYPRGLIAYFFLAISSLVLTNSRSGILSFVLFLALTSIKGFGLRRKIYYTLGGLVVLAILWQVIPQETRVRYQSIWDSDSGPENADVSAQGRIDGFWAGITMLERFPISGVGIGNFIRYRESAVDGLALNAHNLAGQVLGETGLIGALAFSLIVLAALLNCSKARRLAGGRSDKEGTIISGLALACRNAIILLLFEGLFAHNLRRFTWLWLAAFSTLAVQYTKQYLNDWNGNR